MHEHDTLTSNDSACPATPVSASLLSAPYRLTTVGLVLLVALIAFEALAVATAMPAVAQDLGGLSLYALAFGITLATSVVGMTAAGGWSDSHGPAAPLWSGLACFLVGLLLAGLAHDMLLFLLGRLVQGLGAGGVSVALYVLVGRRFPESLRRKLFAAFATAWVVPALVGPLISGLMVEHLGWRWVFLGVPLLALPAAVMLCPAMRDLPGLAGGSKPWRERCLLSIGVAMGIVLLYVGGQAQGALAFAVLSVAVALSLGCAWRLLPRGTLRAARGLPSVIALRGLVFSVFFGTEAFLPLLLAREHGFSAPMAGLVLTTGAVGWCCASWYQGHSRNGWSRYRFLRTGTSIILLGVALTLSLAWPALPVVLGILGWVLTGLGMGLVSASLSLLTLSMSEPGQQGVNSSALQLCEAMAVATSLAIGGSLFSVLLPVSTLAAYLANFAIAVVMAVLSALVVARTDSRKVFID
ncbi:TPA: MFS transporter [Pseudomonas putida]|nr:MFS transporter [Pseudomonas putida]